MNVNGKKNVETIPGVGGEGINEKAEGVNSSTIYLICCKNLCK
jgi:hypothetical protein